MKKELLKLQILITFFGLVILTVVLIYFQNQNIFIHINDNDALKVNYESGFYDKSIDIKFNKNLELPLGAEIYYTLNGDNPTNMSTKYKSKIRLELLEETKVYSLKAVVHYKGQYSTILEKTYILDKNIDQRYDLNVINITSDSKNLYDYQTGILVKGVTYDTNIQKGVTGFIYGNYNNRGDEWLRDSHIVMFDTSGKILLEEKIKLGISGGTSAEMDVKSFKIESILKNFKLNLYKSDEETNFSQVNNYNSFRLRSGSQDIDYGNIKSSIMSRLANESGFDGCTTTTRAVVYLNGNFYGIHDIQQNYSPSFIARKYSIEDSAKIVKYKGSEKNTFQNAQIIDYFDTDLNKEENRILLEQYVDMDNYLLYYVLNILTNNTDWPQNNFQIWKYEGIYNENNKYTDGRYRFLIYDTDLMYYSSKNEFKFFEGCYENIFVSLMDHLYRASGSTFSHVMESEYYRNKFINIVLDLLNTTFDENKILRIIEEEFNKINHEAKNSYEESFYNNFLDKIEILQEEVKLRDEELIETMEKYFDLDKKYKFSIKNDSGLIVKWNNTTLYQNEQYSNEYYYDTYIEIKAENYPGYEFDYFIINGKKYYEKEILIDDSLVKNGKLNIEVVSKKNNEELIISEISAKSDSDWIKITNISSKKVNLSNYYISDNIANLMKYNLPNIDLGPNESIIINGKDNYYSIGDYICNFNLSEYETLYLTNNDDVIDKLYVPRMSSNESYGRYDNSNEYKFFYNYNNERKVTN